MPSIKYKGGIATLLEERAIRRRDLRESKLARPNSSKSAIKFVARFFTLNPVIPLVIIGIFVVIIAYMVYSANVEMSRIAELYTSLTSKVNNSKVGFDKKLFYINEIAEDGTVRLTVGFKSEVEQQQAEDAYYESVDGETSNTNPSSTGVFEKLSSVISNYDLSGAVTSITCNNGKEFSTYSGVPEAWGWSSSTNVVVWHYQNTADEWVNNFGKVTGQSAISTYRTLNKEHDNSNLSNYKGVDCLQICSTAALLKGEFTPTDTVGVNDVFGSNKGYEGVILVFDEETNNYLYIPVYVTDSKAHTYPGGIAQTGCSRYSNFEACYDRDDDSCSDFGKPHAALHNSNGHFDYTDRKVSVEIEANWTRQPIKDNWKIIDVLLRVS